MLENDNLWDLRFIKARITESFLIVQDAWTKRSIDIAKKMISEDVYNFVQSKIELLIQEKRINRLENIQINEINLYNITFFIDNECTSFIATFRYSMIDYYIDETTSEVISGSKTEARCYIEYWSYIKSENGWIVNEITECYGIGGNRRREYTS